MSGANGKSTPLQEYRENGERDRDREREVKNLNKSSNQIQGNLNKNNRGEGYDRGKVIRTTEFETF